MRRLHPRLAGLLVCLTLISTGIAGCRSAQTPSQNAPVLTLTNGAAASLVLGQPDFTSKRAATSQSGLHQPIGIALDPASGKVFVVDASNNRLLRFAGLSALANGASAEIVLGQTSFEGQKQACTRSNLRNPTGLAVDTAGRLWVADADNNRVLRFDHAAALVTGAPADGVLGQSDFTVCSQGTGIDSLRVPYALTVDPAGRLWVADRENNRVLRFDNAAAKLNGAPADGVLGAADVTSKGSLSSPSGIAIEPGGTLWVADTYSSRVLRFAQAASKPNGADPDGELGQVGFDYRMPIASRNQLEEPYELAVEPTSGRLWVADTKSHRVLWFDNAAQKANGADADGVLGQTMYSGNQAGTTASTFTDPHGLAFDPGNGVLWVVDSGNNRVLVFGKTLTPTAGP